MNLTDLITRTRYYVRDINSKRFPSDEIELYINEGIERLRSYQAFADMSYPTATEDVSYLPTEYHYILALFAASRCFGVDNDFFQEQQKRNEFETAFMELITKIECGDIYTKDIEYTQDYVVDEYFEGTSSDEDTLII